MDQVNKPAHYSAGTIEAIDYMKDNMTKEGFRGYLEGCCKKYLHRHQYKGSQLTDLKKAQWYLNRLILDLETEPKPKTIPGTVAYQEHG